MCLICRRCYRPQSTAEKTIILPTGPLFVNGLSRGYSTEFPGQFKSQIDEATFQRIMENLNETVATYWPCAFCWYFGIAMAFFTFGITLLLPYLCINQAEEVLNQQIERANLQTLRRRELVLKLVKRPFYGWLELQKLADEVTLTEKEVIIVQN